jgi:hypothetical protein
MAVLRGDINPSDVHLRAKELLLEYEPDLGLVDA